MDSEGTIILAGLGTRRLAVVLVGVPRGVPVVSQREVARGSHIGSGSAIRLPSTGLVAGILRVMVAEGDTNGLLEVGYFVP